MQRFITRKLPACVFVCVFSFCCGIMCAQMRLTWVGNIKRREYQIIINFFSPPKYGKKFSLIFFCSAFWQFLLACQFFFNLFDCFAAKCIKNWPIFVLNIHIYISRLLNPFLPKWKPLCIHNKIKVYSCLLWTKRKVLATWRKCCLFVQVFCNERK